MIQRDWFEQHIEILAQAIGAALGLKEKGEIQASIAGIETAVQKIFGMSPKLALNLPLNDFIKLTCRGEEPSPKLLSTLAKLFQEWADLLKAAGRDQDAELARIRAREAAQLNA